MRTLGPSDIMPMTWHYNISLIYIFRYNSCFSFSGMVSGNFEEAKDESGVLCLVRDSRLEILDEVDRGGSEEAWSCYIPFCAV
jgi:hypothetical protein